MHKNLVAVISANYRQCLTCILSPSDVTIINRGEHGERFKNIQVHVGPNHVVRNNPVCHDRVTQAHDGEAIRLQCDPPIPGRFVGLQMYGKGILSMCEVVVASRLGKAFGSVKIAPSHSRRLLIESNESCSSCFIKWQLIFLSPQRYVSVGFFLELYIL